MEIRSAKLIVEILDETTGELITREATLGDFKEVKKTTTTRTKKSKDDGSTEPEAMLLDGKIKLNDRAAELCGWEPEAKIELQFEKKGRVTTPILFEKESGNRLTKTFTISCRGSKHDNLAEFGDIFKVVPYEGKEGYFKLLGNIEKEDDIIDVPEEISDPEENIEEEDSEVDISDFDLEL